jgi:DNA modification methylase
VTIETIDTSDISQDPANVRKHSRRNLDAIKASLRAFGQQKPIVIDSRNIILAGNGTYEAAKELGWSEIQIVRTRLTGTSAVAYAIADNRTAELAEWDDTALAEQLRALQSEEFDVEAAGFTGEEIDGLIESLAGDLLESNKSSELNQGGLSSGNGSLAERFGIPPFSILNAREGWWQDRKRHWVSLGIESEQGRGVNALGFSDGCSLSMGGKTYDEAKQYAKSYGTEGNIAGNQTGTSIFDPVLCELSYRWFCPANGLIIDPFAGGSVRGVVASKLGRRYIGHELRAEQVEANRKQAVAICSMPAPEWIEGDSREIDKTCKGIEADFVFSCPPYVDLEVYSDDPADLSTLDYAAFREAYREIIAKSCGLLKKDRFACFVVGDVRDKNGNYYNFVGDTIEAFRAAGLSYYNEAILVTAVGSLPIRVGKQFAASRKLGKTHQNVLVFVKGDGKKAAQACGKCDFGEVDQAEKFGEVLE